MVKDWGGSGGRWDDVVVVLVVCQECILVVVEDRWEFYLMGNHGSLASVGSVDRHGIAIGTA